MTEVKVDQAVFSQSAGKTVLITGAARGIGAATAILFNSHGANVVLADLPQLRNSAEEVIKTQIKFSNRAIFVSTDIVNWAELTSCFEKAIATFGKVDIVIANAGIMESESVLDMNNVDTNGRLLESLEAGRVIDVNLKGTLNSEFPHHLELSLFSLGLTQFQLPYILTKCLSIYIKQLSAWDYTIRDPLPQPLQTPNRQSQSY